MAKKQKPAPKRAKLVTLTVAHIATITESFDHLIAELTFESASSSSVGFARRHTINGMRSVLKAIGA